MSQIHITHEMLEREFTSAFTRIWETQVGLHAQSCDFSSELEAKWLAGVVWLGGQWTGSVTLAIPEALAQLITSRALDIPEEELLPNQARDYVRELANMCAGNLKSALPGPSGLATPGCFSIRRLGELPNDFPVILALHYECEGLPLSVELRGLE